MHNGVNRLLGGTCQINILTAAVLGANTKGKGENPYENQYFIFNKAFHDTLLVQYDYISKTNKKRNCSEKIILFLKI